MAWASSFSGNTLRHYHETKHLTMGLSTTKTTRQYLSPARYLELADKIDRQLRYTVLVVPRRESPSLRWFYLRSKLNGFKVAVHYVDALVLIVRLK